ncbi:MAG: hypothetical protein K940chlam3_01646 [Chlamydiae bacterium]|nr:hypothetical protein [Chlamydiota bacterium]
MGRTKTINLRLFTAFLFALVPILFLTPWFPQWKLTYFAPFLVITFYKKPLETCLWLGLISGLIMDLLSSQHHLGIHALNYCLTISLLYSQKQYFFEDSLSTIPIMTFFFAVISTILQVPLYALFEKGIPLSQDWIIKDLLVMPLIDALYGFIWFTLPAIFLPRNPKREYFLDES